MVFPYETVECNQGPAYNFAYEVYHEEEDDCVSLQPPGECDATAEIENEIMNEGPFLVEPDNEKDADYDPDGFIELHHG